MPCGGKVTTVELTSDEEEVIKISEAHTFSTGLHSEISLPNGDICPQAPGKLPVLCCAMVNLLVEAELVGWVWFLYPCGGADTEMNAGAVLCCKSFLIF